jgi:hypothetical protein
MVDSRAGLEIVIDHHLPLGKALVVLLLPCSAQWLRGRARLKQ